jgi:hypothetical protein
MQFLMTTILSLMCLLLTVLLVIIVYVWQRTQHLLTKKEIEINRKHLEIKRHAAQMAKKEINLREEKAKRRDISILYFTEISQNHGFFRGSDHIKYKMQLFVEGVPVANPFTIKEDKFTRSNQENINKILQEFAKPLIDMGVRVMVNYLGGASQKAVIKSLSSLSKRTGKSLRSRSTRRH